MLGIFITGALLLAAFAACFTLGYFSHPSISRKISYKKRGAATKKRAAVKRAEKLNGSKDTYLHS